MESPPIVFSIDKCDFCGTCVAVCPADAIELRESSIRVIPEACIRCGDCVAICPFGAPRESK
jgi:ferredoxin